MLNSIYCLVCSLSRFTLKNYSRRKFVSSAKQFLLPRSPIEKVGDDVRSL
ncbi:MAG: hypothetical protein WBN75_13420 [Verrucomicrobiia bacterium]